VAHLARTIAWYRHVNAVEQTAVASSDAREGVQRSATRALQLAFEFARAVAPIVTVEARAGGKPPAASSSIERAAVRANERVTAAEKQIAEVEGALSKAGGQTRATLTARRRELLAELNFANQIKDSVQSMRIFLSAQATGGADLLSYIDRLERSEPEALRGAQPHPGCAASADAPFRAESAGIFALVTEAIQMSRVKTELDSALAETDTLRKSLEQLRAPLVADITNTIRRGDEAAGDSTSQDAQQMSADRQEIEGLSARFKQVSSTMVPLREQGLQVEVTRGSLLEQRNTVQQRYSKAVGYLAFRALWLVVVILVVLAISELWRRGTFRYVRDVRRQRQFFCCGVVVSFIVAAAVNGSGE
jgi:hypothetical protein